MSEQRLVDLETKVSYQDALIEELQKTVYNQYIVIEKIEKALKLVTAQLSSANPSLDSTTHQKPPHY